MAAKVVDLARIRILSEARVLPPKDQLALRYLLGVYPDDPLMHGIIQDLIQQVRKQKLALHKGR